MESALKSVMNEVNTNKAKPVSSDINLERDGVFNSATNKYEIVGQLPTEAL